ncbi:MAG: lipoate--protein ligase [Bacillota bacterium]|jgi:lipoate-protein ligase A
MFKTRIVRSTSFDPWYNLALEEHLLRTIGPDQVVLYLWQNQGTVVIGRNQNAWKQCRCRELEADGKKLARRLSGGGAVYHDLGNLNFTFIMERRNYNLERQLGVILKAVGKQGIEAEFSGRNDIVVQGRKFSGNAFYFEELSAYHHGTILVDVDFEDMTRYLQVSQAKMRSKAIESVQARVVNLKSLNPDISIETMAAALAEAFVEVYGGEGREEVISPTSLALADLYQRYSSWEWRYGHTPKFDLEFETRFPWGEIQVGLSLKKGIITQATIYSDAMNPQLIEEMAAALHGAALDPDAIAGRYKEAAGSSQVEDFRDWLVEQVARV